MFQRMLMRMFKQKSSDSTKVTSTTGHSQYGENQNYDGVIEKDLELLKSHSFIVRVPLSQEEAERIDEEIKKCAEEQNNKRKRFSAFSEKEEAIIKKAYKECRGMDIEKHDKNSLSFAFKTGLMGIGKMYLCIDDKAAHPGMREMKIARLEILMRREQAFQKVLDMYEKYEKPMNPEEFDLLKEEVASARKTIELWSGIDLTTRMCVSVAEVIMASEKFPGNEGPHNTM